MYFFLTILFLFVVILAPIMALINASKANSRALELQKRIEALETEMANLGGKPAEAQQADPAAQEKAVQSKAVEEKETAQEPEKEKPKIAAATAHAPSKAELKPVSQPISERKQPKRFVFTDENKARFKAFFQEYWLYILGALTLALSGIYLIRWGIENGIIPPIMRVLFAALLGAGLIYFAERILRKWGDEKGSAAEYLPSAIASAGVSILYAAVFGAYSLYGLIGGSTAFFGLVIIAVIAIIAGLRFGLLLSALGVLGAYLSPFLVGESSNALYMLFGYSLLIMVIALIVDSFRRSAWLSALAMIASLCFSVFIYILGIGDYAYNWGLTLYGFGFLVASVIVPERSLMPQMQGADLLDWFAKRTGSRFPEFPTRIADLGMIGAVVVALIAYLNSWQLFFWLDIWYFFTIAVLAFLWLGRSEALQDLALLPMLAGVVVLLVFQPDTLLDFSEFRQKFLVIVLMSVVLSLLAALASFYFQRHRLIYGYVAVLYPLGISLILQVYWGNLPLHAFSKWLCVLLLGETLLISYIYFQRHGREANLTQAAVIACFAQVSLIGFRILPLEQWVFLNLALMVLALYLAKVFAWQYVEKMSRIFTLFAAVLAVRKIVQIYFDTNLILSIWMPIAVCFVFYGALLEMLKNRNEKLVIQYEGYLYALVPAIVIAIARYVADYFHIDLDYLRASWGALIFFALAFGMYHRAQMGDALNPVRKVALMVYSAIASAMAIYGALILNPLFRPQSPVLGWPIFNSLTLAYAPLCAVIYFVWKKVEFANKAKWRLNWVFYASVAGLILELDRQLWQGEFIYFENPNSMGETVSYTVILLFAMAFAMYKALHDRSKIWRNIAFAILLITAVKVYFIDLTHTAGIARVLVLFVFGAILLGFNFLNRKLFAEKPHSRDT